MTGISMSTMALMMSRILVPPSTLTASAPLSFIMRPAFLRACSRLSWYDMKGISITTRALFAAFTTGFVWWIISSTVTGNELG